MSIYKIAVRFGWLKVGRLLYKDKYVIIKTGSTIRKYMLVDKVNFKQSPVNNILK